MHNNNNIQFLSRSHVGRTKRNNQDFLQVDKKRQFAAIADGIGGKDFGEVASQLGVEACLEYVMSIDDQTLNETPQRELCNAIKYANETIITIQRNEEKYRNMGSTLSCFYFDNSNIHYAWVGDSRIYCLRPRENKIIMLTKDHTLDQSKIDPDLAPGLYQRASSILTQMIGSILLLKPDSDTADINNGDIILACTDGLSDRVQDALILEYAAKFETDLESLADKLLDRALDCGGQDNITLILAKVGN